MRVTAEKAKAPARISLKVEVSLPEALDDLRRDGVIRAIHSCLIHNTLTHPPKIDFGNPRAGWPRAARRVTSRGTAPVRPRSGNRL